jgi:hypothetical protein
LAAANSAFGGDDTEGERPDLFFPTAGKGGSTAGGMTSGGITGGGLTTAGSALGKGIITSVAPKQTLIEQVSEANFIKRTAGTGSFDIAGFRQAEERGNVVINVNAPSVIDEEGFSRAIQLALNNSSRRLGGGGDQLIL